MTDQQHPLAGRTLVVSGGSRGIGQCYLDADLLIESGVTDLSRYGGGDDPMWDIFVDKP